MLKNVEHVILVILVIAVIILGIRQSKIINTSNNYYNDYRKLEAMCDSIKENNESIIDSLCQEIGKKESVIDSLFIVDRKIREENKEKREEILNLPFNESLDLLRKNLEEFYEMD